MACFRGNWEEFYGEVLLLDERKMTLTSEQGIKKSSKAAAVLQRVFSLLNLEQVEFFGLRFCDNKQQTHWLDPLKTLSQHRDLIGPPYIFYFGVKFYAKDPSALQEETTRFQFYLQLRQDVRRGRLPCPAHLRPRLLALMLQAEHDDSSEVEPSGVEENQEIQHIYKSLSGVSRPQAQRLFLSLCSSLQMFGVSLFTVYGENQKEYFLGPTPVGVVIYNNKELVGKYFWQRIIKLHFKEKTFELRTRKHGCETSFFFQTLHRSDCKRLWRCCVEHHTFYRMPASNPLTYKLKHNSIAHSPTVTRLNVDHLGNKTTTPHTNQTAVSRGPMAVQSAPPAVQRRDTEPTERLVCDVMGSCDQLAPPCRSEGEAEQKPSAPWENSGPLRGLFNPKFPPNTKEEEAGGRPQRRSRSLDGDRPIREQRMKSGFHGNTSSGSESQKTPSNSEHRRRRKKNRDRHGNQRPDSSSRRRTRSRSPDALTWRHIQKQLMEPDGLIDRQTEEIPYEEVRISGQPMSTRRSPRRRSQRVWASASDLRSKGELLPPLPVTKATNTSFGLPTSP
ncbi:band 4.1-like protein 4 [Centropristis striata]|uniref:band 4.1-like protein 4 n=1 Tax=Centropristis striata TaxID=184440 RepID=UPI0027E0CE10|nr:band 4.1-like protein 4 [Centropristis striata]